MFQINSLYICVKDMDRAIAFYEDFFERKVIEKIGFIVCLKLMALDLDYLLIKR